MLNIQLAVTALLFSSFLSVSAYASSDAEKIMVLDKASVYARSIACDTTFDSSSDARTTVHDVHAVNVDNGTDNNYVVFWQGDKGCERGSSTYGSFLTLFNKPSNKTAFSKNPKLGDILQEINHEKPRINNRFIEGVQVDHGIIKVTSYDLDEDDCNTCASLKYKHQLAYNSGESRWIVLSEQFIGKRD